MSDLRPVHVPAQIDPGNQGKIIAGIIVALALIVIGAFGWQAGWFRQHQAVPDSALPQASMPLVTPTKG
jgi:hypothetical protein